MFSNLLSLSRVNQSIVNDQPFLLLPGEIVPPPALGGPPFGDPLVLEPGVFNWSGGLHYNDGEVYVGDFFQGRVQVAKAVPEPSSVLGVVVAGAGVAAAALRKQRRQKLASNLSDKLKKTA